jgi:ATP-dependent Clp protease ATP-binding subunit ClpC
VDIRVLSSSAQRVVQGAQKLAEDHKHSELDSSHLFYALVEQTDVIQDWIDDTYHKNVDSLLSNLEPMLDQWHSAGSDPTEPSHRYLEVMRKAQQLATDTRSAQITGSHLLEAILKIDARLADWFSDQGIALHSYEVQVATPMLDRLGRDLTSLAESGELSPVFGREGEVKQIIEALLRRGKNSVLLLGPPGVGKTAIVELLAQRIAADEVPAKLQNAQLVEVNVATLLAGTSYRGQFEERMQTLLREIETAKHIILVIDEFHSIMGAGKTVGGGTSIANMLKPTLARGDVTCIGITTNNEYTRHVEEDGALRRRFHAIVIQEPSSDDTFQILQSLAPHYQQHHQITIEDPDLETVVKLTNQYLPSRHFPDKAIDVLGKVCSRAELQGVSVTPDLIADIVSEMSGVPVGRLNGRDKRKLMGLEEDLAKLVIGQDQAISVLSRSVRVAYTGLRDPRKPKGVFLFVGPSGVGKTELALSLAKVLFDRREALIRLDMSEYSEKIDMSRLIGAAPGYIGHEEPGQLTQPLREHPHSIVLLDEIEKAHPEVLNLFLQLFDEGRLTDSHNRAADGRHAIFVMTSNLGTQDQFDKKLGFGVEWDKTDANAVDEAVINFFRPELLNRVDHVIKFRPLGIEDLTGIAEMEIQALTQRLGERNIRLTYESSVLDLIAEQALAQQGGGRSVKRLVENNVSAPISDALLQASPASESSMRWLHIRVHNHQIQVEWI